MVSVCNKQYDQKEIGASSVYYAINSNAQDRLNMNVTLIDCDQNALDSAKEELVNGGFHRSMIELIQSDLLNINEDTIPNENALSFDTIALNVVLQDIEGAMNDKLPKLLNGLSSFMDGNTSFFGSTITNTSSDPYTSMTKQYMQVLQNVNYIQNASDSIESVEEIMDKYFDSYNVECVGYGCTFEGTKLKNAQQISQSVDVVQDINEKPKARMEKFI